MEKIKITETKYPKVKLVEEYMAFAFSDWYVSFGNKIQQIFPDYTILISGGSFRGYDISVREINKKDKTIRIDCYLPLYMDTNDCEKWAVEFINKNIKED